MAADRFIALIDDFPLDVETIRDGFEKAIAVYEYPYVDGADTEDLGHKARNIRLRCYFLGDQYESHKDFLSHLDQRELFELHHPKYGLLAVRIPSVSVNHDDRLDTAEIDIELIEDRLGRSRAESPPAADVENLLVESWIQGQLEVASALTEEMRGVMGPEAIAILQQELAPELGIVDQLTGLSNQARNYLKTVDAWVNELVADISDLATPANALTQLVNYPANVIGRVTGAVAMTVERYALARDSLRLAPARFLASLQFGLADIVARAGIHDQSTTGSTGFARTAQIVVAQRLAVEAGSLYGQDEERRRKLRRAEQGSSFDSLGRYQASEPVEPVMTVGDLERSLALVRGDLQLAIDQVRAAGGDGGPVVTGLKQMAGHLVDHVGEIKLERERLQSVLLDNPMPLHLVCLRYGLAHQYAERLLAVNNIPHPNFTSGEVLVYVR